MAVKKQLPRGVTDDYTPRECVIITVALVLAMLAPYWIFAIPRALGWW